MTTDHDTTARAELKRDVEKSWRNHVDTLEKKFHLEVESPKNIEEAVERFKAGQFTVRDKGQRSIYDSWYDHFSWHDPSKPKDAEGYKAAKDKLSKSYRLVTLDVAVDPLEKAKSSVAKFREETFH